MNKLVRRKYGATMRGLTMLACLTGAGTAAADSVVVNVTGQILPASCTVGPMPAVTLGDIRDVDMQNVGDASSPVAFQLSLTACPATTARVTAAFTGTADTDTPGLFRNATGTGFATGIGVRLLDADHGDVAVPPGGTSQVAVNSSSATFSLKAQAVTTRVAPVTGNIDTSVTVTFTYQ